MQIKKLGSLHRSQSYLYLVLGDLHKLIRSSVRLCESETNKINSGASIRVTARPRGRPVVVFVLLLKLHYVGASVVPNTVALAGPPTWNQWRENFVRSQKHSPGFKNYYYIFIDYFDNEKKVTTNTII